MPQDIKIWEITDTDKLKEISESKLDLEERLEDWIEKDISLISSDDLLIIGRQVRSIDLLCVDRNGDLVIIELKRDKTPRESTAQTLDYASWVKDLSNEEITDIADSYFKEKEGRTFEKAFKDKFGTDIPEVLNEDHRMIIVASEIDSSSERIIEYLSDTYGVPINAITFQHFQKDGKEFLSRVFLIEPSEAEQRTQTKSTSKRKPPLSYEELEEIAQENGVGNLYRKILEEMPRYFDQNVTTRTSVAFIGLMGEDRSRRTIFSIVPKKSSPTAGIQYEVSIDRFADYFGIKKEMVIDALSSYKRDEDDWHRGDFGRGYLKDAQEIDKFLKKLSEIKGNRKT